MRRIVDVFLTLAIALAILEIYERLSESDNVTEEISEWLTSTRGRFESFYAERKRGGAPADAAQPADRRDNDRPWLYDDWGSTAGGGAPSDA